MFKRMRDNTVIQTVQEAVKMSQSNVAVSSKKSKKSVPEVSSLAFLNMAREYYEAAEVLFAERERRVSTGGQRKGDGPIYFLYYHAMELALKAYRSAHLPNEMTHSLKYLYEEYQKLGLVIESQVNMQNLINLLQSGEEHTRFRYFSLESASQPDLAWVREGIDSLTRTVSNRLDSLFPPNTQPKRVVKVTVTFSKPESRR